MNYFDLARYLFVIKQFESYFIGCIYHGRLLLSKTINGYRDEERATALVGHTKFGIDWLIQQSFLIVKSSDSKNTEFKKLLIQ